MEPFILGPFSTKKHGLIMRLFFQILADFEGDIYGYIMSLLRLSLPTFAPLVFLCRLKAYMEPFILGQLSTKTVG